MYTLVLSTVSCARQIAQAIHSTTDKFIRNFLMSSPKIQTPLDTESLLYVIIQPAHHAGVMHLIERVDSMPRS